MFNLRRIKLATKPYPEALRRNEIKYEMELNIKDRSQLIEII